MKRKEDAQKLLEAVLEDPRVRSLKLARGCQECGSCDAVCPAARFCGADVFSPRKIVEYVCNRDAEAIRDLVDESIWCCVQCGSCRVVCPRGNDPFGLVLAIREAAEFKLHITPKGAVLPEKFVQWFLEAGTCCTPKTPDPKVHPDWGPKWEHIWDNMELIRRDIISCPGCLELDRAWDTSPQAVKEMKDIWHITGAIDNFERHYPEYIKKVKEKEGWK